MSVVTGTEQHPGAIARAEFVRRYMSDKPDENVLSVRLRRPAEEEPYLLVGIRKGADPGQYDAPINGIRIEVRVARREPKHLIAGVD
jgi:hypothetical protein